MRTPDNRAWRRPAEETIIRGDERINFEDAMALYERAADKVLENHEEMKEVLAYLSGTIVGKEIESITGEFCRKVVLENPLVSKVFDLDVPADKSERISNHSLGFIAALLKQMIKKRNSKK